MSAEVVTPREFGTRIRKWVRDLERPIFNSIRRSQHSVRNAAALRLMQRGIGFSIWGLGKRGVTYARKYIKRDKVVKVGDVYRAGWTIKGLPALVEVGGRTKPHWIAPVKIRVAVRQGRKAAKQAGARLTTQQAAVLAGAESAVLKIRLPSGRWISAKRIRHPGSRINARPWFDPALEQQKPEIVANFERELELHAIRSGLELDSARFFR